MDFLRKILGLAPKVDFAKLIVEGATVIDVRSLNEFKTGHPKNAVNIPIDILSNRISQIKKMKAPIIVCCASGIRSARAKRIIEKAGVVTYNAGSWKNIS